MRALLLLTCIAATACAGTIESDDQALDPADCFVGDPDLEPEVQLIYRTVEGAWAPLAEGGEVPLILPPQGGKVFMVGVRARNLDICGVRQVAGLRDQCTGRIVGSERRPVFLVKDAEGWAVPRQPHELSDYSNVPACPSFGTDRDVDGEPYELELQLIDGRGRQVTLHTTVVPVCGEAQHAAQCECECDSDFILGQACAAEDGPKPPPGTCPAAPGGMP
jgi:hypothetical protein